MKRAVRDKRRPEPRQKRAKPKARADAPSTEPRTYAHPLFGQIPLVQRTLTDAAGATYETSDYDPDYAPPLPKGAVRGDVRRQEFCRMCHVPKYFYEDVPKVCVQCGEPFVFGAKEQKHWYETLKFHFDSVAIRCAACRKKKRSDAALERQLVAARAAVTAEPKSPRALLSLAEAIARVFERTNRGKLTDGVGAARAARREAKATHHAAEVAESFFWEATCQRLAGQGEKAQALYSTFLASTPGGGNKGLVEEARRMSAGAYLRRHGIPPLTAAETAVVEAAIAKEIALARK